MQTCSRCNAQSTDTTFTCVSCQADLREFSTTAIALKRFRANSRVLYIRLSVAGECCPACQEAQGTYAKDEVPLLPIEGCSHGMGCRCFYEPVLNEIYP